MPQKSCKTKSKHLTTPKLWFSSKTSSVLGTSCPRPHSFPQYPHSRCHPPQTHPPPLDSSPTSETPPETPPAKWWRIRGWRGRIDRASRGYIIVVEYRTKSNQMNLFQIYWNQTGRQLPILLVVLHQCFQKNMNCFVDFLLRCFPCCFGKKILRNTLLPGEAGSRRQKFCWMMFFGLKIAKPTGNKNVPALKSVFPLKYISRIKNHRHNWKAMQEMQGLNK